MSDALCQAVGRYTRLHANTAGIASTPVAGLYLVSGERPGALCKICVLEGAYGQQDYKRDPENDAQEPIQAITVSRSHYSIPVP